MQSLLILGRQPALGIAELESLYGPDKLRIVGKDSVVVDVDPCLLAFKRLGGSLKFCKILTTLDTRDWADVEKLLLQVSPQQVENMPAGKMRIGLSLHGFELSPKAIMASGLKLKKAISKTGRSVRLVPNQDKTLNSAQVIHNKLTDPTGWELVIIRSDNQTIIAQTVMVQDIDSYTKRDRIRPKRDTRVGMLPPKLAQIIINLSVGKLAEDKLESICDIPADQTIPPPELDQMIFDPFCGTGVVMQEALLMGYSAFGSDIESRMIDYSRENIEWLKQNYGIGNNEINYQVADATKATWATKFDFVASELYLGQPISNMPGPRDLGKIISNCDRIVKTFLINLHKQTSPELRIAIAVPAWQIRPGQFKHLPLIDQIGDLGYNRISFEHSSNDDLIYYRADQIVTRELLVLTRK
jgi:tRNA G10  N-methylase Trm11